MENEEVVATTTSAISYDEMNNYAASLMVHGGQNAFEVKNALMDRGVGQEDAEIIVDNIEQMIKDAKKKRAQKDMLYGALWCVGGVGLTLADVGFIFWGAIIFGAIQFFKGVSNL